MKATGKLIDNKVIVEKPKDVGRLHNKSKFGKLLTGNKIELNLLEAAFLLDEDKLNINCKDKIINFQRIVELATKKISSFEIKYLIFKDLRKRGHVLITSEVKHFDYEITKESEVVFISIFSERDEMNIAEIQKLIERTKGKNATLWFAIVDEEGDLTYYEISSIEPKGKIKKGKYGVIKGTFLEDRVIIFDEKASKKLFEKEFFGKPFGGGIQISLVESLYLIKQGFLKLSNLKKDVLETFEKIQPDVNLRLIVFSDLKNRGLIVKTGFKFGTHFRAYTKKPGETHAEYLVHGVEKSFKSSWADISRAVRLAHSVNKEILFASISNKEVYYIKLGRLRP